MRSATLIIATAALVFLAAACTAAPRSHVAQLGTTTNQSTSPGSSSGSDRAIALEFSQCMRGHGVAKFPDLTNLIPLRNGVPKVAASMQQLGVTASQFQSADNACRHLLPNGGQTTPTQSQQDLDAMRRFAACMRSHGIATWPDPTNGPAGWGFNLLHVQGFDPNSPQTEDTMNTCQQRLHSGFGIPLSRPGSPG